MAKTKANEREFVGQAVHWVKKQIDEGGLPFRNATNDSSLYGLPTVQFPDVLVTEDFECKEPFCGWECKTPKTDVRDTELLKNAVKKAQLLGAKYFVTWNMQSAIIWRTPEKTRVAVNETDKVREVGPDWRISRVDDVRDQRKAEILEETCRRLMLDLGKLHEDERINLPVADTTVFVGMVSAASEKLAGSVLRDINKARGKKSFNKRLNAWAKKQGVSKYDQEYYETLAQQMAYKIIGKILFYLTLRRQNLHLPRLDLGRENYNAAMKRMRGLFQLGLEVDYQAIFEGDITDEIELSRDSAVVIIGLTEKLGHWSFELMPLDVIGNVFERLVPEDARHSLGQYFTPDNLVDLISAFCIRSESDYVMDPTCGTGTFLIGGYKRLRNLGAKRRAHHKLLEQVWGFDIAGFPAELATINLCRQDLSDYLNFPRVLSGDFFDVQPGQEFEFPPPKKTRKTGERIRIKIRKFDALVGNFPFIRQELIEKAEKGYKKKLEAALFENWGECYPDLFKLDGGKRGHELRLSGQADIYAYMFFHAAAHLKVGGRMGFITSNSWLDVAYGYELQKFFLSKFKLIGIFESRCEPWFEQSAVNTVFTVLERCDDEKERAGNYVRFVKMKKPLAELLPQDSVTDAQSRGIALERFVDKIEEMGDSWGAFGEKRFRRFEAIDAEHVKLPEIVAYEDDEVRVRMVRQGDAQRQVGNAGETVKWGQYLRGPDIYFELLQKCAKKLVPLSEVAKVRRGITTGINEFFYLTPEMVEHWGIEEEFLKPVIKSPKECDGINLGAGDVNLFAFLCRKEKGQLRGTKALKYIKWGEKQKTKEGRFWPDVESAKGRRNWYELPDRKPGRVLVPMVTGRSERCIVNACGAQVDHNLFEILSPKRRIGEMLGIYLNSAPAFLSKELTGRANLGDGALKVEGIDWKRVLVPNRELLKEIEKRVKGLFKKILGRKIRPFEDEAKRKDRIAFEEAVAEALGLGSGAAEKILAGVVELVKERHLLPKLRRVRRKKRVERDLVKLRDEVVEEVLPNGVRRFPDAYVKGWGRVACEELAVPAAIVKLGENFMGKQEICDAEGNHIVEEGDEVRAKFIVYAKRADEQIVRIPEKATIVKKAVQDYEADVRDIRDRLYVGLMEKCGDHAVSENLAAQVLEDHGLPDLR
ncbi:MAG: N-6 DNA methylase [Planctomycetes bacterium]|nr:N-6 DNA methylase [Planctomycetota bacterium]